MKTAGSARIRPYRATDLDDLYLICLRTADNGADATALYQEPRLPGQLYAAPYGLFEPSLAFVAEDDGGVGGYIVGALDSLDFDERLERLWWPWLRRHYPAPPPSASDSPWTADQRQAYNIHHPWLTSADLAVRYPSHLHINLLPRLQARGVGAALVETLLRTLRALGSPGVHLHASSANQGAVGFYRHLGFAELSASATAVAFGRKIRPPAPGS